ncbi:hypothetical protein QYF36_002730 [Acer negundo]|nr:hypothetical protein QYF36_002730 [Acer negundo]
MISLRGTEVYRSILEDIIFQCIGLKKKLSFGQIGRVAVMIFGSGIRLKCKSTFVDWLVHLDGKTEPVSFLQADGQQSIGHVLEGREHNFLNVNVFAEAFKKIGNPLVIVSLVKGCPNFTSPGAILVDMMTSQSKEDILGILFPKNEEFQGHAGAAESDSASLADQDMNTHNINEDKMEINLIRQFWKIFESLNLVDKEKGQKSIVLNAPSIKVCVKKIIHLLIAVMDGFIQKNPFDREEDKRQLDKAVGMLEQLKQLYAILDVRTSSEVAVKKANYGASLESLVLAATFKP